MSKAYRLRECPECGEKDNIKVNQIGKIVDIKP